MIAATVVGNLGRDAELKTVGNTAVLSFAVASERKAKGEKTTTWVSCSLWGSRGETLARYLTKGSKVAVAGELSTRESTKTGKTYLELRVDQLELLGGGSRGERQALSQPQSQGGNQWSDEEYGAPAGGDDDIPF